MQRQQGLSGECEGGKKGGKKHLELFDRRCTVIAAKSETDVLISRTHLSC